MTKYTHNDVKIHSEGYELSATIFKAQNEIAGILIVGGGANMPRKEGYYPGWQKQLAKDGISSLSFDFRGVGESEVMLSETSINTRIQDAQVTAKSFDSYLDTKNIYIAGISMGAPIAVEVGILMSVKGLILISPAAYSFKARDKKFGPEFSETIRKPGSWKDSPDFKNIKKFKGKTLLACGLQDKVVPLEILETYSQIISKKGGDVLSFDNAGHRFMRERDSASTRARKILKKQIVEFVHPDQET